MSGSPAKPSLANNALMCFSTARSVMNSEPATAALLLPEAISASTSRFLLVSPSSGDDLARLDAATSTSTIAGSITDPPRATARTAATNSSGSLTRSLSR